MKHPERILFAAFSLGVLTASAAMCDCCAQLPGDCNYTDQNGNHYTKNCGQGSCCVGTYGGEEPGGHVLGDLAVLTCCPPNTTCNFYSSMDGTMHVRCRVGSPIDPGGLGG